QRRETACHITQRARPARQPLAQPIGDHLGAVPRGHGPFARSRAREVVGSKREDGLRRLESGIRFEEREGVEREGIGHAYKLTRGTGAVTGRAACAVLPYCGISR
ncbi:MAG: hypothetical protein ACK55I_39800, partial [bacterium]